MIRPNISLVGIFALAVMSSCASRPSADVLHPVRMQSKDSKTVTVMTATNRLRDNGEFGSKWSPTASYQSYRISVPQKRDGTIIRYPSSPPKPAQQYFVTDRTDLALAEFRAQAKQSAVSAGIAGIFVHGYNYSFQEALYRVAQMGADSKTGGSPILFSWPSLASVAGYVGDRDAALASRSELDALVTSLSKINRVKRIVLFGHSMGGFLVMETVRELKLKGRKDVLNKLIVVLAAPDIDLDVFRAQLADVGRLKTPITLLVSKTDRALAASSLISGERVRVGRLDIDDPSVLDAATSGGVRVIDISAAKASDGLGHDRYASLAKFGSEFVANEINGGNSGASAGAYLFNAAGIVASSPFRLVGRALDNR